MCITAKSHSANLHKRKRRTRNNSAVHKAALTHRVHSRFQDHPRLSTAKESKAAPAASTTFSALKTPDTSLIDAARKESTEAKVNYRDDEAVFRIRQNLIRLGIELQENARTQIRRISQVEDFNKSHVAINVSSDG